METLSTDYEKMKALFDDLGVEYVTEECLLNLAYWCYKVDGYAYNQWIKVEHGGDCLKGCVEFYFYNGTYVGQG